MSGAESGRRPELCDEARDDDGDERGARGTPGGGVRPEGGRTRREMKGETCTWVFTSTNWSNSSPPARVWGALKSFLMMLEPVKCGRELLSQAEFMAFLAAAQSDGLLVEQALVVI